MLDVGIYYCLGLVSEYYLLSTTYYYLLSTYYRCDMTKLGFNFSYGALRPCYFALYGIVLLRCIYIYRYTRCVPPPQRTHAATNKERLLLSERPCTGTCIIDIETSFLSVGSSLLCRTGRKFRLIRSFQSLQLASILHINEHEETEN